MHCENIDLVTQPSPWRHTSLMSLSDDKKRERERPQLISCCHRWRFITARSSYSAPGDLDEAAIEKRDETNVINFLVASGHKLRKQKHTNKKNALHSYSTACMVVLDQKFQQVLARLVFHLIARSGIFDMLGNVGLQAAQKKRLMTECKHPVSPFLTETPRHCHYPQFSKIRRANFEEAQRRICWHDASVAGFKAQLCSLPN